MTEKPNKPALSTEERLFVLINKHANFPACPLTLSTCIQTDLGLEGDEAGAMLQEIQSEFHVNLQEISISRID